MSLSLDTIKAVLEEFPNAPSRAVARIAYARFPSLWPRLEACRAGVTYLRGNRGDHFRKHATDKSHFRPNGQSGKSGLAYFAKGDNVYKDKNGWAPFKVDGPAKVIVLTDVHVPYHDKQALMTAVKFAKRVRPDLILLGGDIADCHKAPSKFITNPLERDFKGEVKMVREFLERLRDDFSDARIIYKLGNHEERYENFMCVKAPELIGIKEFEIGAVFKCADRGIEMVEEKRPIRLGNLNFIHGHEYRFAVAAPVVPARGLFLKSKSYAMCGHFHQPSHYPWNTLSGEKMATWSTGCLCGLHPRYAPLNDWQHGFAFVEVDKAGGFQVHNKTIKSGKIC